MRTYIAFLIVQSTQLTLETNPEFWACQAATNPCSTLTALLHRIKELLRTTLWVAAAVIRPWERKNTFRADNHEFETQR